MRPAPTLTVPAPAPRAARYHWQSDRARPAPLSQLQAAATRRSVRASERISRPSTGMTSRALPSEFLPCRLCKQGHDSEHRGPAQSSSSARRLVASLSCACNSWQMPLRRGAGCSRALRRQSYTVQEYSDSIPEMPAAWQAFWQMTEPLRLVVTDPRHVTYISGLRRY